MVGAYWLLLEMVGASHIHKSPPSPPTSTPAEVRQYHRELHEKLDVLPFADGLAFSTRINADGPGSGSGSGVVNSQ
jgi:hypothetical protein